MLLFHSFSYFSFEVASLPQIFLLKFLKGTKMRQLVEFILRSLIADYSILANPSHFWNSRDTFRWLRVCFSKEQHLRNCLLLSFSRRSNRDLIVLCVFLLWAVFLFINSLIRSVWPGLEEYVVVACSHMQSSSMCLYTAVCVFLLYWFYFGAEQDVF